MAKSGNDEILQFKLERIFGIFKVTSSLQVNPQMKPIICKLATKKKHC